VVFSSEVDRRTRADARLQDLEREVDSLAPKTLILHASYNFGGKSVETTKLSSKGQVIIPKHIRDSHHWGVGLELQVIELEDGILLKPRAPFEQTNIEEVAGCLQHDGPKKSDEAIQAAMRKAAKKIWHEGN
jgi:AbrB family looped-hinge helix DNA binding protein